jgi:hypothetical protein
LAVLNALFAFVGVNSALAQEPPLTIPSGAPPAADPDAIAVNGWQLYPALDLIVQNSNNYFLSTEEKVSGWALGVSPSVTAEWSNGIHTTTLYGTFQELRYLGNNGVIANDGEATFTQRYAPLRELTFTFLGDYTHQTISSSLTSAIPSPITTTGTTVLANGNTVLPNGTIVSPSGQIVGQSGSAVNASSQSAVNPYDQYTATGKVEKLFSDGIVTLGASVQRRNYDLQASEFDDFTAKTFTENAAFWLGPVFYAYSDGSYSMRTSTSPTPDSTAYRVLGGIGTRQFGLFRASLYFGHQGSDVSGSGTAGGDIYGGALTYYPKEYWTIKAAVDETINISSQTSPSTQAINIGALTPVQIPLSSSTNITAYTLKTDVKLTPKWTASGLLGFTRIEFIGSPALENVWLADATIKFNIRRDLSLTWEYQYSSIISNVPMSSANRNLIAMRASYKF